MDKVFIHNLEVEARIGVYASELTSSQPLVFHLEFEHDFSAAFTSDALEDALNYDAIQQAVRRFCAEHRFGLLETLAGALMRALFEAFEPLEVIRLRIEKPRAIAPALAAIECCRSRSQLMGTP